MQDVSLKLSEYLNKNIIIELVVNEKYKCEDEYKYINYAECRINCSICCNGFACGLETNLSKILIDNKNFNIQDLEFVPKKWYPQFPFYYVTSDEITIKKLREKFLDIGFNNYNINERVQFSKNKCITSSGRLTSNFDDIDVWPHFNFDKVVDKLGLCPVCYFWAIKSIEDVEENKFRKVNPLKILWFNYFEDHILQSCGEDFSKYFLYSNNEDYKYILSKLEY